MSESAAIERHADYGDKLAEVMGGGDVMAMVTQVEANVRAITDIARKRGFITKFEQVNKKTGEVKTSEFYGLSAWQILGMAYGVTPVVEWVKPVDGGFHARAIAQTRDGAMVGAAEAFCHKNEPGKGYKSPHDLAAVAQGRAERNALRAALGAILVLAGYDVPDPDAPATKDQLAILHILEREIGFSAEEGHAEAGVASYIELSREQASDLIDRWTAIRDELGTSDAVSTSLSGVGTEEFPGGGRPMGKGEEVPGDSSPKACSHPSWKRSQGELRCTKCGVPKRDA